MLSLNEIEAMVWKAARGTGLAWGLAEELGQAARWLADRGFEWAGPLVAVLGEAERCGGNLPAPTLAGDVWVPARADMPSSPALCGPLLSDLAGAVTAGRALRFGEIAHPLLMLPFAGRAAQSLGRDFSLALDGLSFSCRSSGVHGKAPAGWPPIAGRVVLALDATASVLPLIRSGAPRRPLPAEAGAQLEGWVQRTYVPASAASRLAGAGAGLTDND